MENIKTKDINIDSLIGHVFKLWVRSKKQILDKFNLTLSQYEVLSAIYNLSNCRKEIIQIDLSEKTGIDPMTISTVLRNLEKNNLIIRLRGTVNTRVVYVELTEEGKCLYKSAAYKISLNSSTLYRNIDERNLSNQLLVLSNELQIK